MLEDLGRTPEEKRNTEIMVQVGVAALMVYVFGEMVVGLGVPVMIGAVAAVLGSSYAQWLRKRWSGHFREVPIPTGGREE